MRILAVLALVACSPPAAAPLAPDASADAVPRTRPVIGTRDVPACSKLGPHVNGWNADAQRIALACPPLVKFLGAGSVPIAAIGQLRAACPAIQAAAAAGGGWSYHAYTNTGVPGDPSEPYLALRYRIYLDRIPELRGIPLLLTEGGFDLGGNPETDGWHEHLSPAAYLGWLAWFDAELNRDSDVVGVTLFSVGAGWPSFDLGPVVDALRDEIVACR